MVYNHGRDIGSLAWKSLVYNHGRDIVSLAWKSLVYNHGHRWYIIMAETLSLAWNSLVYNHGRDIVSLPWKSLVYIHGRHIVSLAQERVLVCTYVGGDIVSLARSRRSFCLPSTCLCAALQPVAPYVIAFYSLSLWTKPLFSVYNVPGAQPCILKPLSLRYSLSLFGRDFFVSVYNCPGARPVFRKPLFKPMRLH